MNRVGLNRFLLARITEDEWNATGQVQLVADRYREEPYEKYNSRYRYEVDRGPWLLVDPRHVLAECAAKRRIVAIHEPYDSDSALCAGCDGKWEVNECPNLAALAAVYADHPDYDPFWKI